MAARYVSTHRQRQICDLEDEISSTSANLSNQNWYFADARSDDIKRDDNPDTSVEEEGIDEIIKTVVVSLRHQYGNTLPEKLEELSKPVDQTQAFETFWTALSDQLCKDSGKNQQPEDGRREADTEESSDKTKRKDRVIGDTVCVNCIVQKRVENVEEFKAGQHIRLPGNSTFKLGKKLVRIYSRHAIVKEVVKIVKNTATLKLIHYLKEDGVFDIRETTETYNLKEHEITIVQYKRPRHSPEQIIRNAENMVSKHKEKPFGGYNLFFRNCEHFATCCVVGEGESFQAKDFFHLYGFRFPHLAATGTKIARFSARVLANAADDFAAGFKTCLRLPGIILGGTAAAYLIYCLVETKKSLHQKQKKQICQQCFRRKLKKMWAQLGVFAGTSGIAYLITHFALPLLSLSAGVPLIVVMIVLSIALQWSVPTLIDSLKSPLSCDKIQIKKVADIKKGDILDINYCGLHHAVVVCEVNQFVYSEEEGRVLCVHYVIPGGKRIGTKEVIEEWMVLNTTKMKVFKMDDRFFRSYIPDEVVARARMRVGETKWSLINNRSEHVAYYAKVIDEDNDKMKREQIAIRTKI